MEIRSLALPPQIEGRIVTGYAARFDTPSQVISDRNGRQFREVIARGAFARSIESPPAGDILALWSHGKDGRPPLGRTPNTLRLWEDANGLRYQLELPESAADVREAILRGDVKGLSFGFLNNANDRWTQKDGIAWRELLSVGLIEISFAVFPAYPGTSIEARDVSVPGEIQRQQQAIERAKKLLRIHNAST